MKSKMKFEGMGKKDPIITGEHIGKNIYFF